MDPPTCFALEHGHLPADWESVRTKSELRAWTSRHDTEAVLLPALLQRSAFRVIGKRHEGGYIAGAVLHLCSGVVDISNVWTTLEGLDWTELVSAAAALFPGRALVGYEYGANSSTHQQSDSQPSDRSVFGSVDTAQCSSQGEASETARRPQFGWQMIARTAP